MSVELKCDRCMARITVSPKVTDASVGTIVRNANLPAGWGTVVTAKFNMAGVTRHLCADCRRDLTVFLTGTEVPRKSLPADKIIVLQHEPAPDCELAWDPDMNGGRGGLMCAHDDAPRFDYLVRQSGRAAVSVVMADDEPAVVIRGVGECRMCKHPKHGTDRCLSKKTLDEGGKCVCVGALEDQLRNVPTQRSAPHVETSDE